MYQLSIIIALYFFLHLGTLMVAGGSSPALYYPVDDIAVNCGSSGNSTALDGRQWIGDTGSKYIIISQRSNAKLISTRALERPLFADPVPYLIARISRSQFTYTFQVTPGQKFIRLHFYPASYPGFERSKAFFTVKAGPYTLLSNFSAFLTAEALGLKSFAKEFCVNVEEENQPLTITFSPSPAATTDGVYAFVNGIEIVSIPTGLYHTREGDPGVHVVSKKYPFSIDNSIALEMVQRLSIGGSFISSVEDTGGMFREWSEDSKFLLQYSSVNPVATTIRIKYTKIPIYTAPQKVYQTSWSVVPNKQANKAFNITWKLPVDLGFRYLVRFHFCEIEYEIEECANTEFSILINNNMVETNANIVKWSGANGVAVYRDYVVMMEGDRMEGKCDLLITLCPHESHTYNKRRNEGADAIVKGLEVFKLSNPDNNLAGVNPMPLAYPVTPSNPNDRKLVFTSGGHAIATGVVLLITILNIIVYQLRIWGEKIGEKNILSLPFKELYGRFTLAELQSLTNNFDDKLLIGCGGFGKVYKGLIDSGATAVAIKRLNSKSKQGANEFWAEIETLSKVRHMNLVSLIGYCDEYNEMILVYDYMKHGTLADHLYKINCNGNGNINYLSWEQRLKICIGAACGLDYLHTGIRHGVVHRDVKSANILLDENWVAKISDFGLCKFETTSHSHTHISTEVKGTFGYLDPEYFLTRRLTKKSDVYGFGVVLLEVLCGRPAVDTRLEEEQRSLSLWAQHCIKEGKLGEIIDPSLRGRISSDCLTVFAEVAIKCLHYHANERPTMADVVASLKYALASQVHCRDSSRDEAEEVVGADGGLIDENRQIDDASIQGTIASPSTPNQNIQVDDANVQGTIASPSTPNQNIQIDDANVKGSIASASTSNQYNENVSRTEKWSKGKISNVFQRSIPFLDKVMDIQRRKRKDHDSKMRAFQLKAWLCTHLPRRFSIAEIQAATSDFNDNLIVGQGDFTRVYRGRINNGTREIAIRCLKASWSDPEDLYKLETEIRAHCQLRHLHIISLIGYCIDQAEPMLVYDYMANRSLCNHLYGTESGFDPLPWKRRLEICIGAARGVQHLHSGTTDTIVHRNIKPTKILLDGNWVPKVTDFELSRVAGVITCVSGTTGYMDPEYFQCSTVTEKSDVYSFGVVLLEVLCAKRPWDPSRDDEDQRSLVRWFRTSVQMKTIDKVIDPYLVGKIAPECLREFVKVTLNCLMDLRSERPSMDDVVESLQSALQLQQTWPHSDIEFVGTSHSHDDDDNPLEVWSNAYNTVLSDTAFSITDVGNTLVVTFSTLDSD